MTREALASMRGVLCDKILEVMKKGGSQSVFRPIMPPKIFTDMYQYFQASVSMSHTRDGSLEITLSQGNEDISAPGLSLNLMAPKLKMQPVKSGADIINHPDQYSPPPQQMQPTMLQDQVIDKK